MSAGAVHAGRITPSRARSWNASSGWTGSLDKGEPSRAEPCHVRAAPPRRAARPRVRDARTGALPERSPGTGTEQPLRPAAATPAASPRSVPPSAGNAPSFRQAAGERPSRGRPGRCPRAPRSHVPERRCCRPGRAAAHTDRAFPQSPRAPLTCARCPGTRGSGPCGGSASGSAPTARGSPRRAASEHVRAPGMRAGAAAPPSPAPAPGPPGPAGTRPDPAAPPSPAPAPGPRRSTLTCTRTPPDPASVTLSAAASPCPAASAASAWCCLEGQAHLSRSRWSAEGESYRPLPAAGVIRSACARVKLAPE